MNTATPDAARIAEQYIAVWNETDAERRLGVWAAEAVEAKRAKNEDSVVIPTSP